jgi:hypothetical protein
MLLPLRFNDGTPVPGALAADSLLKSRFQQIDIWLTTYSIEVL